MKLDGVFVDKIPTALLTFMLMATWSSVTEFLATPACAFGWRVRQESARK